MPPSLFYDRSKTANYVKFHRAEPAQSRTPFSRTRTTDVSNLPVLEIKDIPLWLPHSHVFVVMDYCCILK